MMHARKFILVLDQGTTSSRAIIFDSKCNIKAIAQKPTTQITPKQGYVEQDPMQIYQTIQQCYQETLHKSKLTANQIASIGITNQRETTVVWNRKTGLPVYNAIVWMDSRTKDYVEEMSHKLNGYDALKSKCGLPLSTYFSAFKIRWILDHVIKGQPLDDLCFGTVDSWLIWVSYLHRI